MSIKNLLRSITIFLLASTTITLGFPFLKVSYQSTSNTELNNIPLIFDSRHNEYLFGRIPEDYVELARNSCLKRFGDFNQQVTYGFSENYLSVPFHYQEKLYWCGPAALHMVFDYYKMGVTQFEIAEVARSYPWTTYTDELRRASHFSNVSVSMGSEMPTLDIAGYFARKIGYAAFEQWGMTLDDLRTLIDNGFPVIVLTWYSPSHGSGHFRVIIGYNETHIFVHDPWNNVEWGGSYGGSMLALENAVFLDLWDYSYYWGLLVSPWQVNVEVPSNLNEGETFTINATVMYPCPSPFSTTEYPASSSNVTIILPRGLSLVSGETAKKRLETGFLSAGESAKVSWNVRADNPGIFTVTVEAQGIIEGDVSQKTDPTYLPNYSYEDCIGGVGECNFKVHKIGYPPPISHDVGIIGLQMLANEIYSGQIVDIEVMASNLATCNETFKVSAYYDLCLIGTRTVTSLPPSGIINIIFKWNTKGVPTGNHTVSAQAHRVPGEVNITNNVLVSDIFQVVSWPSAYFDYFPSSPKYQHFPIVPEGISVTFDARISDSRGGEIISYAWDFEPDGIIDAYGPVVNHTYITPGYYGPTLTITDSEGLANFTWTIIEVKEALNVPAEYATIRQAIEAANPEDIIAVSAGTYYEHYLTINKPLTILGENRETTIIDGEGNIIFSLDNVNDVVISEFTIQNGSYSIQLSSSNSNIITNCICLNSTYWGIGLHRSSGNIIRNCEISNNPSEFWSNNSWGILLLLSTNNIVENCKVMNAHHGVGLHDSSNNNVISNVIASNNFYGIKLYNSSNNNVIQSCISYYNFHGISLATLSGNDIIRNCNVSYNQYSGFDLMDYPLNNTISDNIIASNTHGIDVHNCSGNIIYHNNFLNNTQQVCSFDDSINVWDNSYPSGGNFWGDYANVDLFSGLHQNETGSDGIGDAPYVIDENNADRYPLIKPYAGPHDVGVTSLTTSKTIVGQGYGLIINTSILNYGNSTENVNLTIYFNTTIIYETNINLTSRNSITVSFTLNTTGFAKGNYTLWAYASIPGEADTEDNTKLDGWVIVAMIGDITGPGGCPDGKVDIRDIASVAILFGVNYPDPRYDPNCDFTGPTQGVPDGKIDIRDISLVARHFGETDP